MTVALQAVLAATGAARATDISATFFGHRLEIQQGDDGRTLRIDDVDLLKNWYLGIDEVAIVGGIPVIIGTSSNGGNACAGAPFVVSFPEIGRPRIDGPLDTCWGTDHRLTKNGVEFFSSPVPGRDGERWEWTLADAFTKEASTPFQPDRAKGWAQLRERTATHPSDILDYGEIATRIYQLLGPDKDRVVSILTGVGTASFDGDWFIGQACLPHSCGIEEGIVVASLADKDVFLAWKPEDQRIVVRPPVAQWPDRAKSALRDWAKKWK
ncbi:hypothetical protein E3C22_19545 [Jiella endophytica]|uniref:Uncharacterized protein n=1 Tax=Jiella endophytica TaxID=2558362 RepID=A0A4Y8RE38_9HYPH|nr:hypothetical protein [Jiella endophytica]TFF19861.1 hypothetical protein E3C22_19545 [Jiella endophytica]